MMVGTRVPGRVGEAITLHEQVLTDYRRVLGDDNANTAAVARNLSQARAAQQKTRQAVHISVVYIGLWLDGGDRYTALPGFGGDQ
jgi:hypothetical protein